MLDTATELVTSPFDPTTGLAPYMDRRFIIDDCLNLGVWDDQKFLGDWDAAFLPKR